MTLVACRSISWPQTSRRRKIRPLLLSTHKRYISTSHHSKSLHGIPANSSAHLQSLPLVFVLHSRHPVMEPFPVRPEDAATRQASRRMGWDAMPFFFPHVASPSDPSAVEWCCFRTCGRRSLHLVPRRCWLGTRTCLNLEYRTLVSSSPASISSLFTTSATLSSYPGRRRQHRLIATGPVCVFVSWSLPFVAHLGSAPTGVRISPKLGLGCLPVTARSLGSVSASHSLSCRSSVLSCLKK